MFIKHCAKLVIFGEEEGFHKAYRIILIDPIYDNLGMHHLLCNVISTLKMETCKRLKACEIHGASHLACEIQSATLRFRSSKIFIQNVLAISIYRNQAKRGIRLLRYQTPSSSHVVRLDT